MNEIHQVHPMSISFHDFIGEAMFCTGFDELNYDGDVLCFYNRDFSHCLQRKLKFSGSSHALWRGEIIKVNGSDICVYGKSTQLSAWPDEPVGLFRSMLLQEISRYEDLVAAVGKGCFGGVDINVCPYSHKEWIATGLVHKMVDCLNWQNRHLLGEKLLPYHKGESNLKMLKNVLGVTLEYGKCDPVDLKTLDLDKLWSHLNKFHRIDTLEEDLRLERLRCVGVDFCKPLVAMRQFKHHSVLKVHPKDDLDKNMEVAGVDVGCYEVTGEVGSGYDKRLKVKVLNEAVGRIKLFVNKYAKIELEHAVMLNARGIGV